ncbi:biotin transporter BioY [Pseudoscardovia suis]|uniref:Biotin biosynthesis protein BioY n=1 Tax=Pseudoscardovia suis TaxID=987063 RepID=A0A261F302_9BIFI|nr:biotin transporter BioY [Pseudoscardovia suis]OZG53453.1 biotin biosynthesis protein BioY [Pseudoscardovia suis]PJJ68926.1 biotin transport system substrate-specific component [Pseudoscardovia suis]
MSRHDHNPHRLANPSRSAAQGSFAQTLGIPAAINPRDFALGAFKIAAFAGLLCVAAMVGRIQVPGTEVGITLQTFVLMIAALTLTPVEAGSAALLYLAIGAAGAPVFSNGASTAALVGPSAGFLFGFVPAAIITALLKAPAQAHADGHRSVSAALTLARNFIACALGCILVPYAVGISVQSIVTGTDIRALAAASAVFFIGDTMKAIVATAAVTPARAFSARRAAHND